MLLFVRDFFFVCYSAHKKHIQWNFGFHFLNSRVSFALYRLNVGFVLWSVKYISWHLAASKYRFDNSSQDHFISYV